MGEEKLADGNIAVRDVPRPNCARDEKEEAVGQVTATAPLGPENQEVRLYTSILRLWSWVQEWRPHCLGVACPMESRSDPMESRSDSLSEQLLSSSKRDS